MSMSEKQLNGSQRVLLDQVISEDECGELQRLSNVSPAAAEGKKKRKRKPQRLRSDGSSEARVPLRCS